MRQGGGKQKGAQFEREVCVALSKWVTKGAREDVFWRSAMSGGRATVAAKKQKLLSAQVGDITCIDPVGQSFIEIFAVECKFYADLDYQGLLTGKGKLLEFWREINNQAVTHRKYPFLVARQNRMRPTVGLDKCGALKLGLKGPDTLLISHQYDLWLFDAGELFEKPFTLSAA